MDQVPADRLSGGIFLVGLAVVALSGQWWPGILVLIGVTTVIRGLLQKLLWKTVGGALWLIALALVFHFGFPWPLLPLLAVAGIVVGARHERNKRQAPSDPP
ncbi:MAG: hypothetical protein OXF44_08275 [Anaerolineaceae bacterium]|nr:hypothetical protein [Anaerolineaceae bacterium]